MKDEPKHDQPKMPKCPWCKTNKMVYHEGDRNYFCSNSKCKRSFDDDPDEGGDYSHDPTRRLQREEQRAQDQRAWMERKSQRR